jgi:predicted nucleic acid-binding protein
VGTWRRRLDLHRLEHPDVPGGCAAREKSEPRRLLEACIQREERLVTDAEVLREIPHRCAALRRRDAIQPAFDAVLGVIHEIFPVELEDVEHAKTMLPRNERLSARGALHVAVMERRKVTWILTFDEARGVLRVA